jgi:hypothetical protein
LLSVFVNIYIYIYIYIYIVCTKMNGAVSKVNNKFISYLTRAQPTPSAAATVRVSHALRAVRFSCLLRGRGASFQDGVAAGNGYLCAPFRGVQILALPTPLNRCTKLTLHCNHRSGHLKTEHTENLFLRDFSHTSRPDLGPTQASTQWVQCLSRG